MLRKKVSCATVMTRVAVSNHRLNDYRLEVTI